MLTICRRVCTLQSSLCLSIDFNSVSSNIRYALISLIEAGGVEILMIVIGIQNLPEAYTELNCNTGMVKFNLILKIWS